MAGLRPATYQGGTRYLVQYVATEVLRLLQTISVLAWKRRVDESLVPVRHVADQGEKQRPTFQQGAELREAHVTPERGGCIGF